MRYSRRTLALGLTILVFAALALSCGGGSDDDDGGDDGGSGSNGDGSAATATSTPRPVDVTKAEAALEAIEGSGVTGTTTFEKTASAVAYNVTASGLTAGAHAMYVVQSSSGCTTGGRIGPLTPLEAADDGTASASGEITTTFTSLLGDHFAVFAGDSSQTDLVACGEIVAVTE